jgi:hypothetical protein
MTIQPVGRELLLGSDEVAMFTQARGIVSVDAGLVQLRIYAADGQLLGHLGLAPGRARAIAAKLTAAAARIDPAGAMPIAVVTGES